GSMRGPSGSSRSHHLGAPPIFARRLPRPAAEGATESAGIGEPDATGDVADLERALPQVYAGEVTAHGIEDLPEARAFLVEAPCERARADPEARRDAYERHTPLWKRLL